MTLGLVDEAGLKAALDRKAELGGGRIGEHLIAVGACDEESLLRGLARQRHVPFADATLFDKVDTRLKRLVPRSKAFHYRVVPVRYLDGQLVLATCESANLERVRELVDALGHKVRLVLAPRQSIEATIARLYSFDVESFVGKVEPPKPARHRLRGKKLGKPRGRKRGEAGAAPELDTEARAHEIDEIRIARELAAELPQDSGVFQLTREALLRLRPAEPIEPPSHDGDTEVRRNRDAAGDVDEDAQTVLDTEMAARIRAELGGEGVAADSGLWAGGGTGDRMVLSLPPPTSEATHSGKMRRPESSDPADKPPVASGDIFDEHTQPPLPPEDPVSFARMPMPRAARLYFDDETVPPENPELSGVHGSMALPEAEEIRPPMALGAVPGMRGGVGAEPEAQIQSEPFGNYRLLRKIKTGGMAEVFEASTPGVEGIARTVAIKRILPNLTDSEEFVTMFIDEAKITVQLSHAAIGQVYELGRVGESYFIAMEYIHGRDLNAIFADAYEADVKIPVPVAAYIAQQVYEGLDYAHRKADLDGNSLGIVHRDVSPANVLCSFEGLVKIIDFGIAKAVSKVSLTRPGLIKGKISYMSPEQMRGQPVDRRSDIFAMGIVLYEMLAGRRLFSGNSDVETIRNVLKGEVPPLGSVRPDLPGGLVAVVERALQRDPARRFAWASDASLELQRVLLLHDYSNPRGELLSYMDQRFGGVPASEEDG